MKTTTSPSIPVIALPGRLRRCSYGTEDSGSVDSSYTAVGVKHAFSKTTLLNIACNNYCCTSPRHALRFALMIKSFKHKGLKRFFAEPRYMDLSGIGERMSRRLIVVLDALDVVESASEMDIAGLYFHPLKGKRKGYFSVRITGNWRVTWRMEGKDVADVNLEDYH